MLGQKSRCVSGFKGLGVRVGLGPSFFLSDGLGFRVLGFASDV